MARDPLTLALQQAARRIADPLCRRWLLKLLEKGEHAGSADVVPPPPPPRRKRATRGQTPT